MNPQVQPSALVTIQPSETYRFRENSDNSCGTLKGRAGSQFLQIQILNYFGDVNVKVSLRQVDTHVSAHPYLLLDANKDQRHHITPTSNTVDFEDLLIKKLKKTSLKNQYIVHELRRIGVVVTGKITEYQGRLYDQNENVICLDSVQIKGRELKDLKAKATQKLDAIKLSECRLVFDVIDMNRQVIAHALSEPIKDHKSWDFYFPLVPKDALWKKIRAIEGKPLIVVEFSRCSSSAKGGKELWIKTVDTPDDVIVRFVEGADKWKKDVETLKTEILKPFLIIIKIPPYKDQSITKPVNVFLQLVSKSGKQEPSTFYPFTYKPNKKDAIWWKRQKSNSLHDLEIPSVSDIGMKRKIHQLYQRNVSTDEHSHNKRIVCSNASLAVANANVSINTQEINARFTSQPMQANHTSALPTELSKNIIQCETNQQTANLPQTSFGDTWKFNNVLQKDVLLYQNQPEEIFPNGSCDNMPLYNSEFDIIQEFLNENGIPSQPG